MVPTTRRDEDRVLDRVRHALTASGFDEAMTPSVVPGQWCEAFSPWTREQPLLTATPLLRRADRLRTSLAPSLLDAMHTNQNAGSGEVNLFEIAKVYLPRPGDLPLERWTLAMASGRDYRAVKGVLEAVLLALHPQRDKRIEVVRSANQPLLEPDHSGEMYVSSEVFGYLGELTSAGREWFQLRDATTIAEVCVADFLRIADLIPRYRPLSPYPPIDRDLNLVVGEQVRWADLAQTVRTAAGSHLERLEYLDTYRNDKDPQLGATRKAVLLTLRFRSAEGTLTNEQADAIRDQIVAAAQERNGAQLRT
jgi:phenylalanyl-tRNA synthetase beta chain